MPLTGRPGSERPDTGRPGSERPDTGRPGSERPDTGRVGPSLPVRRAVFFLVLLLVVVSLAVTLLVDFRTGGYVLAGDLLLGGVARAVLPDYLCLGLLVRSRQQDAATLLLLGVLLATAASILPDH